MKIVMSSGHGSKCPGAVAILDEHKEAVRVVNRTAEYLRATDGVTVVTFEDTTSTNQQTNLETIVAFHNAQGPHDLDAFIHFNCNVDTTKPVGVECWYMTQDDIAAEVASNIAMASGLKDRGAKFSDGLYVLKHSVAPAVLPEICFVDSQADVDAYLENFDAICSALAAALSGSEAGDLPGPEPEPEPDDDDKPTLGKGDKDADFDAPYVSQLQEQLNVENNAGLDVDGDFGPATDNAVRAYQASRGLDVDGLVGEQTWTALDAHAPPLPPPPGLPPLLSAEQQQVISDIAINSSIADYSWKDRGRAPAGYIKGFALAWANTYRQYLMGYSPAIEMSLANSHNADKDVLGWYAGTFDQAGMSNDEDGPDTLRHLWALLLGLGMRESSGKHCEGRDTSADNVSSDTAEAGLYQTSYNAHSCSNSFDLLFDASQAAKATDNQQGLLNYFMEGVPCGGSSWQNYGSGNGAAFQDMCKKQPAFTCETCAIVLRKLRQHYGPINRREAELKTAADEMLKQIQDYVDETTPTV